MTETTAEQQAENHRKSIDRFIALANTMKDEGLPPGEVSHALMYALGIYATYAIAGNNGLNQAGVEKLTGIFKSSLEDVQKNKKEQ